LAHPLYIASNCTNRYLNVAISLTVAALIQVSLRAVSQCQLRWLQYATVRRPTADRRNPRRMPVYAVDCPRWSHCRCGCRSSNLLLVGRAAASLGCQPARCSRWRRWVTWRRRHVAVCASCSSRSILAGYVTFWTLDLPVRRLREKSRRILGFANHCGCALLYAQYWRVSFWISVGLKNTLH